MREHRRIIIGAVVAVLLIPLGLAQATGQGIPLGRPANLTVPVAGDVVVNEFVAVPQTTQTTEWVELFNTTESDLDISGMYIDDVAGGGGAPKQIPANTTIPTRGFYVMTFSNFLNNGGDDVRFLASDATTVLDAKTYTTAQADKSWCRQPDGGSWALSQCTPSQGTTNGGSMSGGTTTWTSGNLEIYVLNVGQGESQLIIGPTGRSLLIGVYESSWNTNQGAQFVASEIRRITGSSHVNYMMPSHWHLDHMGYAGYGGIWSLLEQQGITTDAIIDRDGGTWVDSNNDNICDPDTEIVWHNIGTVTGTARNWVCWVTDPSTIGGQKRQLAQLGSTTQIDLGITSGVTVKIVEVDANGVMQADGVTPVGGDHSADATPPSENDYSTTLWVNWGKFDYIAAGDSDGEYTTSSYGYTYNDVESVVASRIGQEVEAAWVNHHGSEHSSHSAWISTLSPQAVAFSCGTGNSYGHPGQSTLDNFHNEGTTMYFTQPCDPTRNYYDAHVVNGNVVFKVTDGVHFTVNGDAYTSTDPVPAGPRLPAVGEVLVNEVLPAPQTLFSTEWIELYNTTGDSLDISGMWVDDVASGGGAPIQIPSGTTLAPHGYFTLDTSNYFNNGTDDARLLSIDLATIFDSFHYTSYQYDKSWCRHPDGSSWSTTKCTATKGAAN